MNSEENEILTRLLGGKYSDVPSNIEGSPFLSEDFKNGKILYKDKIIPGRLRYNVVKEEMHVLLQGQVFVLKEGMKVEINDKPFYKKQYRKDGRNYLGYFEAISKVENRPVWLLKKHFKKIRPGQAAGAMRPAKSPRYVDNSDFYLKINDSEPFKIHSRSKKFLKSLPKDHQEKIKIFIKEKKLTSRSEEDLMKIMEYYNSLF